jgi:ABC-type cobalt transport system substrate-binding protein
LAEVNFGLVPPPSGFMENKSVLFGIAAVIGAGTVYFVTRKRKKQKHQPAKKKQKKRSQPAST